MNGVFSEWQPRYAEKGIATFPVGADKNPLTQGYLRTGLGGSKKLAKKFSDASALGLGPGHRSGTTVVDIDTHSKALLADVQERYGQSPFIVQTPGGYHLWYQSRGERRRIRPDPDQPIDILGSGGFVIAPPSKVAKGEYKIIQGTLDDLDRLPPLHRVLDDLRAGPIPQGRRDRTIFKNLLCEARHCDDFESLLDVARSMNMDCVPQMRDAQVIKIATSVWNLETSGNNWVGRRARASTDRDELLSLSHDPGAVMLLLLLRVSHPPQFDVPFAIDQLKTAELLGWSREMLRARISTLLRACRIARVHYGKGTNDPHLYRLKH
jgi:hypothetical protein